MRLTLVVPRAQVVVAGDQVSDTTEQLSVDVPVGVRSAVQVGPALREPPWQVTSGSVTSFTVMAAEQVPVLPEPSVAVQVTLLVPRAQVVPEGLRVREATLQLSAGVAVGSRSAVQEAPASRVAPVQVTVGSLSSVTVTVVAQVAVLPEPSTTVKVAGVLPRGQVLVAGTQVWEATEQLSAAVPVGVRSAVQLAPALMVPPAQVAVGLEASVTVTLPVQVSEALLSSVMVSVTGVTPRAKGLVGFSTMVKGSLSGS